MPFPLWASYQILQPTCSQRNASSTVGTSSNQYNFAVGHGVRANEVARSQCSAEAHKGELRANVQMLRRNSFRRKSLKKTDISRPSHFEHRIHAEHDPATGDIRGLPTQWRAFLGPDLLKSSCAGQRPHPVIDPSSFTQEDISGLKRIVGGGQNYVDPRYHPRTNKQLGQQHPFQQLQQTAQPNHHPQHHEVGLSEPANGLNGFIKESFCFDTSRPSHHLELDGGVFVETLASLVDAGDPRAHLRDFAKLDEGSTGLVYTASTQLYQRNGRGWRTVVVKCMNVWQQQRRELLLNEVLVVGKGRRHPNLVDVYGSYLVGDELWLVMEWMDGGSLTHIVTKRRMNEVQIASVIEQCLHGLAYLHSRGIIHRDIKSDSILLSAHDGRVKLSDFGFCGHLSSECPKRRSLLGTPYWFSPTVAFRLPYGTEADIWSLGITIIEMVVGEPPHFDDPPSIAMRKIMEMPAPRFPAAANVSPELDSFLSMMLVKEDNGRSNHAASATELLQHPFLLQKAGPSSCLVPLIAECRISH